MTDKEIVLALTNDLATANDRLAWLQRPFSEAEIVAHWPGASMAEAGLANAMLCARCGWESAGWSKDSINFTKIVDRLAAANAKLALLSDPSAVHTNILRGTLPLTKAQAIHIAGLPADIEQQLAALDWRPITPENLPKAGDEVLNLYRLIVKAVIDEDVKWASAGLWLNNGYRYFRLINPPKEGAQ